MGKSNPLDERPMMTQDEAEACLREFFGDEEISALGSDVDYIVLLANFTRDKRRAWTSGVSPAMTLELDPLLDTEALAKLDLFLPSEYRGYRVAADIEPERVEWLWQHRIPLAMMSLLEGDPGIGKSLVILDLVARISRGDAMPDGSPSPSDCLSYIVTEEDNWAHVVVPRLISAGALLDNVLVHTGPALSLPEDVDTLGRKILAIKNSTGASHVIVYLDPLVASLSPKTDSYKDHSIRQAMGPIHRMCEQYGATILGVRHTVKANLTGKAIHSGQGNVGIIAAARAALLVSMDQTEDHLEPAERRRLVAVSKNNLSPTAPTLAFRIQSETVSIQGEPTAVPRIDWLGTDARDADAITRQGYSSQGPAKTTIQAVREVLKSGPVKTLDVFDAVGAETGVKDGAIRHAARKLGVLTAKEQTMNGRWWWALPEHVVELRQITGEAPSLYP